MRTILRAFAGAVSAMAMIAAAGCSSAPGGASGDAAASRPREQFYSVIYERGVGAPEVERELRPDTLMTGRVTMDEFRAWGGKYLYQWFNVNWFDLSEDAQPPKSDDPDAIVTLTQGLWDHWDQFRAAGVLTGPRPAKYEDLFCMSRAYAQALHDNAPKMPDRLKPTPEKTMRRLHLCINNPDVRRMVADIVRFNEAHGAGRSGNGGFVDLVWEDDWSEFTRAKFDQWVRQRYAPEQVQSLLEIAPGRPIPLLPPRADADLARVYQAMEKQFRNENAAGYFSELKAAAESVVGKGNFHLLIHGDGFGWVYPMNMIWWGDRFDSYCTEPGIWPGLSARSSYTGFTVPDLRTNLYDFQYGAGRLWGEPMMLKGGYFYSAKNPQIGQLGVAEGLTLLGNMGLYASRDRSDKVEIPGSWVKPMVDFAHRIAPQVREMIPAAQVGVVFDPVDRFAGLDENRRQVYELCNIFQRLHVPFRIVHLNLLEATLRERPAKTLIVPWCQCVSDAQAKALKDFARAGGGIVFVGDCGGFTWEAARRKQSAFADWMPQGRALQQEGAGRTLRLAEELGASTLESNRDLYAALSLVNSDASPSVVRPDEYPSLLVNLARNSNNSAFWMHLLNYDVSLDAEKDSPDIVRPLKDVRVIVPLPAGLQAQSARLYRPGMRDEELAVENGREGCVVTVPQVEIYALVQVATQPGSRPYRKILAGYGGKVPNSLAIIRLTEPDTDVYLPPFAGGSLTTFNLAGSHATKKLVPPPGPLPAMELKSKPQRFIIRTIAYAAAGPDKQIHMQLRGSARGFPLSYTVYSMAGVPLASGVVAGEKTVTVAVPAPGVYAIQMVAGMERHGVSDVGNADYSARFTGNGGASFEASREVPLELRKAENDSDDAALYYFYVPKACRSFRVVCDTTYGKAIRVVVKGPTGTVALDQSGDMRFDKPLEIQASEKTAGQVWSLMVDDAAGGKRKYSTIYLDGVPPMLAETPAQLLIAQGDE